MAVLWSIGPLIVVLTALWLAVGTRKIVHQRRGLAEAGRVAFADRTGATREQTARLHRDVDHFGAIGTNDTDLGSADR